MCKPGWLWLWPLRMAKRFEWAGDERRQKAEHGGVGTPHSHSASGMAIGSGAGKAGSVSWRSRARRLVGSVARRPSGRDLGTGVTSKHAFGPPNRAGGLMPRRSCYEFKPFFVGGSFR